MKRKIDKFTKRVINRCPSLIQGILARRLLRLPDEIPSNFKFKIAETEEELEASFRLVYESYVELGYCDPNPHKLRATVYHALSTTTTLIALDGDRVIGTLTIVRDNLFKLPLEKVFDISALRKDARRTAEITSLVIHPDYRREKGGCVLFPLLRYMYQYSTEYFGVDHLVVSIHPKDSFFYKSLMKFEDIPGTGVVEYMGAPAICLHLDLFKASVAYINAYGGAPATKNLYDFFKLRAIPNLIFPERKYLKISDPFISKRYYEELFLQKLEMGSLINALLEESLQSREIHPRDELRIDVDVSSVLSTSSGAVRYFGKVKDVSLTGMRFFSEHEFSLGEVFDCKVQTRSDHYAYVKAKSVWRKEDKGYGLLILEADESWNDFITYLYEDQKHVVA